MASILIKGIPEDLHRRLRARAERNRRSMNQEAMTILESAVNDVPPVVLPKHPVKPVRKVTAKMITAGIRRGRK